jgi:hypothetical protein
VKLQTFIQIYDRGVLKFMRKSWKKKKNNLSRKMRPKVYIYMFY